MKNKRAFDLSKISSFRNEIFGFAILSIVFYHFFDDYFFAMKNGAVAGGILLKPLTIIFLGAVGSMGVEIFLILSGMGLYFSFSKDDNLGRFYKKRFTKILIPYIPVALIFWAIKDFVLMDVSFSRFLQDVTFVTFFTNGTRTIWYAGFIMAVYLIFPLIYKAMYQKGGKPRKYNFVVLILAFLIPILVYFASADFYHKTEIALTRIPSFVSGVLLGYYVKQNKKINAGVVFGFCIISVIGALASLLLDLPSFLARYLDGFYAAAALVVITALFDLLKNAKGVSGFFRFFSKYTFELYIIHVTLRNLMKAMGLQTYVFLNYSIMIAISLVLSILLERFSEKARLII